MSTSIEWTNATWNPLAGCTPVSPGCVNCYAARMAMRLEGMGTKGYQPEREMVMVKAPSMEPMTPPRTIRIAEVKGGRPVFTGSVRAIPDKLTVPLHWRQPRMIFVNSMSDLFHEVVPFEFVDQVFAVMALCPQHTFQVLTKRPERMAEYLHLAAPIDFGQEPPDGHRDIGYYMTEFHQQREDDPSIKRRITADGGWPDKGWEHCSAAHEWPLPNVWLGTSVEDQERANQRIPHLLKCPAAVRFLSCEPLLGAVDLSQFQPFNGSVSINASMVAPSSDGVVRLKEGQTLVELEHTGGIHWVIAGGESGPKSRPCNIEWIRSIVQQCKAAGVPCFVKQLGAKPIGEWGDDTYPRHHLTVVGLGGFSGIVPSRRKNGQWRLSDRKGGTPSEWPQDLRVREMPMLPVDVRG